MCFDMVATHVIPVFHSNVAMENDVNKSKQVKWRNEISKTLYQGIFNLDSLKVF